MKYQELGVYRFSNLTLIKRQRKNNGISLWVFGNNYDCKLFEKIILEYVLKFQIWLLLVHIQLLE